MSRKTISRLIGFAMITIFSGSLALAQVFQPRPEHPRQDQPIPKLPAAQIPGSPPAQPGQIPGQPAIPQQFGGPPGALTTSISFSKILGPRTKTYIHLGNMQSPFDSNFSLGRGLVGSIALEKDTYKLGNGENVFIHISGSSLPATEKQKTGAEVCLQFPFPEILFKTYYKDYTGESDSALSDLVAQNVLVDVCILPTLNEEQFPTYHSIRIAVTGTVNEAAKCTHFFNIIFPVNICKEAAEYFNRIQPALQNGILAVLLRPQTRAQFEQQMVQFVRHQMLMNAGVNPNSPARVEVTEAEFRGTDYVVSYLIR